MTLIQKIFYIIKILFTVILEATHITLSAAVALLLAFMVKPESAFDIALAWTVIMGFIFEAAINGILGIIHDTPGDLCQ